MDQITICKSNPKCPMFYTSLIQYILELNEVCSNDADLLKGPKIFYNSATKLMEYYKDKDDVYYYTIVYGKVYYDLL